VQAFDRRERRRLTSCCEYASSSRPASRVALHEGDRRRHIGPSDLSGVGGGAHRRPARARAHDERQPPFAPTDFAFAGPPLRKGPCCDAIRSSPLISEAPADRSLPPGLDPLDGPDCRTRQVVWSADGLLRPRYRAGPPAYRASSWSPADAPLGRVLLMVSAVRRRDPGRVCSLLSGGGRRELDAL